MRSMSSDCHLLSNLSFSLWFSRVSLYPQCSPASVHCVYVWKLPTNQSIYLVWSLMVFFLFWRILKHLSLQIVHVCQFPQLDKCFSFSVPSIFFTALSFLCLLLWIVFLMSSFLYVHFPNPSLVVSIPILITHIAFYFNDIIFHFWYV